MNRYPRSPRPRRSPAGALAVVALGALVLLAAVLAVRWLAGTLGLVGITAVVLFEVAVIGAMWLDWREARLEIGTWRRAWLVAHATVVNRTIRRVRWYAAGWRMVIPPRPVPAPRTGELAAPRRREREGTRAA